MVQFRSCFLLSSFFYSSEEEFNKTLNNLWLQPDFSHLMTAAADLTPPSGAETMTKSLIMPVATETGCFFFLFGRGIHILLHLRFRYLVALLQVHTLPPIAALKLSNAYSFLVRTSFSSWKKIHSGEERAGKYYHSMTRPPPLLYLINVAYCWIPTVQFMIWLRNAHTWALLDFFPPYHVSLCRFRLFSR